jgi:two-component system LytT family response regulator
MNIDTPLSVQTSCKIIHLTHSKVFDKPLDRLIVSMADGLRLVPIEKIMYLNSDSNYTYIHLLDGTSICGSKTMKHYIHKLPVHSFLRIHRSYFVATKQISHVSFTSPAKVILCDDTELPLSRRGKNVMKKWLDVKSKTPPFGRV